MTDRGGSTVIKDHQFYVTLLRKYIKYVRECEGVDYIGCGYQGFPGDTTFTDEEWAELELQRRASGGQP